VKEAKVSAMGGVKSTERIRAFVALDLDAKSVRRVVRVADRLRMASGAPSATWTPQGNVHLTLKFMADLPAAASSPLGAALAALVDGGKAPQLGTCRLQAFPSVEQASVVVIALADPLGQLAKLAGKIDKLGSVHGVARESRAFVPHVTLARLKRPYDSQRWLIPELAEAAGELTAAHLTLYRSDLGATKDGGAAYVPLASFPYGGG
jgi:RNA 2',3'-cyclic 3'-phosphodiesterase